MLVVEDVVEVEVVEVDVCMDAPLLGEEAEEVLEETLLLEPGTTRK
jgi:hypothetical protein